jgi:hypothetical protein
LNKCQMAGFFDVSRPTIGDWARRGAPVSSGDPGAVAEWLTRRDMAAAGLPAGRLPELVGQLARERANLERRIASANALPAGKGLEKACIIYGLMLERELLDLPARIIASGPPESLPEKAYELTLAALRSARGEDTATSPPPADTRRGAGAPGRGPRCGAKDNTTKGDALNG